MKLKDARNGAYQNALLWGIGNGLVSTSLIIYWIRDIYGANPNIQTTIAWVIAAPRIFGLLRLCTPYILDSCGHRKNFVIACYLLSPLVLLALPLGTPFVLHKVPISYAITFIVGIWCLYHLIENLGTIAYWAWLGDWIPDKFRGRILGFREACLVAGVAIGALSAGLYTYFTRQTLPPNTPLWHVYLRPTYFGIIVLLLSALPLLKIPEIKWKQLSGSFLSRIEQFQSVLRSRAFCSLLFFGCWLQMSQAVSQSARNHFQIATLGITLLVSLSLTTSTRIGQCLLGGTAGKWHDIFGTFYVLFFSLLIVSSGSLFYIFATPEFWYIISGAAVVWIAWIAVNIGISKLILQQSPKGEKTAAVALYFTATTLCFGLFTFLGGLFADAYKNYVFWIPVFDIPLDTDRFMISVSFVLRLAAVLWLVLLFRQKDFVSHGRAEAKLY